MPKQKNSQTCDLITNAAYQLFLEHGYVNTTYQGIENLCGIKRTLIQYYFPKKTMLAMSFFEKLLAEIINYVNSCSAKGDNKFLNMYLIGQIHFSYLLIDEKRKNFIFDILSSRELTDEVLTFNYNWGIQYLGLKIEQNNAKLLDDIISAMGGFYELLYRCIKENRDINLPYQLGKVLITIMENFGYTNEEAKQLIVSASFDTTDFSFDFSL